jgi:hypothetical protein
MKPEPHPIPDFDPAETAIIEPSKTIKKHEQSTNV